MQIQLLLKNKSKNHLKNVLMSRNKFITILLILICLSIAPLQLAHSSYKHHYTNKKENNKINDSVEINKNNNVHYANNICLKAIKFYEEKYDIPNNLLYAITIVESGKWDKINKIYKPWPWTLNVNGKPYFFANKYEAEMFMQKQLNAGVLNIDGGCGQVNWQYHGQHFKKNPKYILNPVYNIAYSAYFLNKHYVEHGNWDIAIAYYHSKTSKLGKEYLKKVKIQMNKLRISKKSN